jgi:hypothetical protein
MLVRLTVRGLAVSVAKPLMFRVDLAALSSLFVVGEDVAKAVRQQ